VWLSSVLVLGVVPELPALRRITTVAATRPRRSSAECKGKPPRTPPSRSSTVGLIFSGLGTAALLVALAATVSRRRSTTLVRWRRESGLAVALAAAARPSSLWRPDPGLARLLGSVQAKLRTRCSTYRYPWARHSGAVIRSRHSDSTPCRLRDEERQRTYNHPITTSRQPRRRGTPAAGVCVPSAIGPSVSAVRTPFDHP